jgi:hypothetical protein
MHSISNDSFRALPYTAHEAISYEPPSVHTASASSQFNGFADVAADSPLVRCRGRAAILGVLATFGVVCQAQMTPQDASGVTSCEIQLASCQAVLGKVGAREADGLVPRAAIMAETGTSSSASKGGRLRSSPIACQSPGTHGLHAHRRQALHVCARPVRAAQGRVRSSARTRAARCSRPKPRRTPSRMQPAAHPCCGTVERIAVRAGGRPAGVSPGRSRLFLRAFIMYGERLRFTNLYVRMCPSVQI